MAKVSYGNLRKQEVKVEKYLLGERESNILCTTDSIANILRSKYPVKLSKRETVNIELGLYIFLIKKDNF